MNANRNDEQRDDSSPRERPYLHGYDEKERQRLREQARFAEYMVYEGVNLSNVKRLLELGCGVGAQSEIILRRFSNLHLTGVDASQSQLDAARQHLESLSFADGRWDLFQQDATMLELEAESFDGGFLCWILEHVDRPAQILSEMRRMLRPGGLVYVTEVMNSSFFLDPYSPAVWKYWMAFNDHQYDLGGDPFVGAKLGNLLLSTGYRDIETRIKSWNLDNRQPARRQEMIDYWHDLLLSAAPGLIAAGVIDEALLAEARREMTTVATHPNAVFIYSFMQARARVA